MTEADIQQIIYEELAKPTNGDGCAWIERAADRIMDEVNELVSGR